MKLKSLFLVPILALAIPARAYAILDFIGQQAKDLAKSAAYAEPTVRLYGYGEHLNRMLLLLVASLAVLMTPYPSYAILDFIGQQAKDAAKSVAYADAVGEVVTELAPSTTVSDGAHRLNDRLRKLNADTADVLWLSDEMKGLLEDPTADWSQRALDENIRFTSRYIQRMKRMLVKLGLVGTDVATAMNTAETNSALNEVLKNQQTQILLTKEAQVSATEREVAERKTWEEFIAHERLVRSTSPQGLHADQIQR